MRRSVAITATAAATAAVAATAAAAVTTTTAAVATAATTTVTTTAATTATATVAATTAAVGTATAAATAAAFLARAGFVDGEGPAIDGLAVELADRRAGPFFGGHRDEAEAARLAGDAILHQQDFGHGAGGREQILEIVFGRVKRQITDV